MTTYAYFVLGVIVSLYAVASLFFFKFWRKTNDRLFLGFAVAFAMEGLNRVGMLFLAQPAEGSTLTYGIRVLAFTIILVAIVDRNYSDPAKRPPVQR